MTAELSLITVSASQLPTFTLNDGAKQLKEGALMSAALIGKVSNADENSLAVNAQKELKRVTQLFEKERKRLKEPIIEAGRKLDRLIQNEVDEVDKELGRLSALTSEFQVAEQRRIREEEEAQRREIARIEAEKQAELRRIADEQARVEREAREAREAAERQAREATNKAQREAALKARQEAEAKALEAAKAAALMSEQQKRIEDDAAAKTMVESKPIQATRETGQVVKTEWEISVVNPYELAKFHPDCVKIEPLLTPIKAALNEGREVKGVRATKRLVTDVRTRSTPAFIEV